MQYTVTHVTKLLPATRHRRCPPSRTQWPNDTLYLACVQHPLTYSAANKRRILDMGGMETLVALRRSGNEKIRQQAGKAMSNLESELPTGK